MSLSRAELEHTVSEAARAVAGGRIEHVADLGDLKIALEVHARGEDVALLLCASPGFSRVHLLSERRRTGQAPGAFVMLLRKHLTGTRVESLALDGPDRVVRLVAIRPGARFSLLAELTGRHANVFLLGERDRILGSLRPNVSHRRDLWPGQPYAYPLPRRIPEVEPRFGPQGAGRSAEALYERLERAAEIEGLASAIRRCLRGQRERLERRRAAMEADRAHAENADHYRRLGEILVANLARVRRGAASARLIDWSADPPAWVEVPLDPALSPRANAERYFRRYRKYQAAEQQIAARLAETARERAALAAWEARADAAGGDLDALRALRDDLAARGLLRQGAPVTRRARAAEPPRAEPFRRYLSRDGRPILVGKSAEDNDALTFQVARGNDLWLHARDYPGSHVVVPLGKGEDPSPETLLDAATLAAYHSDARGAAVVEVRYARRKFVHKPRGAAPGRVAVSDARTIAIRIEPDRLARLLRRNVLEES